MTTPSRIDEWLELEHQVRSRLEQGAGPGVAAPEQVRNLSGLEMLQAMLRGSLPYPTISKTMDFMLLEVGDGRSVFQGVPSGAFLNPMGTLHGGWYSTLLDSAMGCAVQTALPAGRAYTTAEISVNIVRAVGPQIARVRAEGYLLHCGRQLATAEGRLVGPDGTLYAHSTTTCLIFELPKN